MAVACNLSMPNASVGHWHAKTLFKAKRAVQKLDRSRGVSVRKIRHDSLSVARGSGHCQLPFFNSALVGRRAGHLIISLVNY
jgi:hypothetical protein